jgi:hypothetical protein
MIVPNTDIDWRSCIEALLESSPAPDRSEAPGSRSRWPSCGARCRGARAGRTCLSAGCGFGARCALHGGLFAGRPKGRRLVLLSGPFDLLGESCQPRRDRRRWQILALPVDLAERLPPGTLERGIDGAYMSWVLEQHGVRRDVARKWPQWIGFNVARKLAERRRVAYALVSGRLPLRRLARLARCCGSPLLRVGPEQVLASLRAAGQQLAARAAPDTECSQFR